MFLKGWIGFLELKKGRSPGEIPVLGNSSVLGQREKRGGRKVLLAEGAVQWQLPAAPGPVLLRSNFVTFPMAPQGLCV